MFPVKIHTLSEQKIRAVKACVPHASDGLSALGHDCESHHAWFVTSITSKNERQQQKFRGYLAAVHIFKSANGH
jgi:hypothetical protein